MGKGGTPPSSQTVTQTNLPDYVEPQFESLLSRADAESRRAYQPYTGKRRTGITTGQEEALGMAEKIGRQGYGQTDHTKASIGLRGAAGYTPGAVEYGYNPERALQGTQYTPGSIGSSYVAGAGPGAFQAGQISGAYDPSQISSQYQAQAVTPTYQAREITPSYQAREITPSYQAGTISSSYNPQASDFQSKAFTDPGVAAQYMNPFVENVVDRQSAKMRQDFQETQEKNWKIVLLIFKRSKDCKDINRGNRHFNKIDPDLYRPSKCEIRQQERLVNWVLALKRLKNALALKQAKWD